MKIIEMALNFRHIKSIKFEDSKGVVRIAMFSLHHVEHSGWDVVATLHNANGKLLFETSYYQSTGNFLDYANGCKEVTAYRNSVKNGFSGGYIWKEYQNIE